MDFTLKCEKEEDGRWVAGVPELPGALSYGESSSDAMSKALRVLTERFENGKCEPLSIRFFFPNNNKSEIALGRCIELMKRYLGSKKKNHALSDGAQVITLILTVITPVLLLLPFDGQRVKIFAAATSALAAISTGWLSICGWRETYLRSGYTYHVLNSEMNRYLAQASDDYVNPDRERAAQNFSRRIEEIYMAEVNDWRSALERIEQKRPPDDGTGGPPGANG